jgi:hypothetical protein
MHFYFFCFSPFHYWDPRTVDLNATPAYPRLKNTSINGLSVWFPAISFPLFHDSCHKIHGNNFKGSHHNRISFCKWGGSLATPLDRITVCYYLYFFFFFFKGSHHNRISFCKWGGALARPVDSITVCYYFFFCYYLYFIYIGLDSSRFGTHN